MTFVAIFLVNAALSFALSLVVAHLVGPAAFGRYAVALAASVVINTALFEWLRLSTTRFYSERVRSEAPAVGATLDIAYATTAATVTAATALLLVSGADLGLPAGLLAASAAVGLSVGLFDYRTAQARARFLDRRYAALLLARGGLAFALSTGAAWLWRDPTAVLGGSAMAAVLTLALLRERGRTPHGRFDRALLARFARYALPLVAASAVYQLLPLLNRSVLAARSGFAEAGYFSLAGEIAVRLFQNLGSALDLALFQLAVRAEERDGAAAGERQTGRNLGMVAAVLLPSAIGLCVVWPNFEAIFVPSEFRGAVAAPMMFAVPAFAAYALVQYGLNPIFQIRHRTAPVIAAALAALAANLAFLFAWPAPAGAGPIAAVQLAGFGAGLAVLAALAIASRALVPWRDLALSAAAASAMGAALWPWRDALPPVPGLAAQVAAGMAIYGALALLLDIAGARSTLLPLSRRWIPASNR
ncbi:lipopolysaccharide biosynthesis protein [Enterovirga aerilata]|uniref:Lipopolysaccharide biosynthesis protein n=1 Tax=Enterovirga aerilata TaxID=2730920 RepID=A0A849IGX5_9HYPH|nr:lipopolysaccharide biosynthesis protein [Enterovirga sp. DB1703]NNM73173.1 lipopolysaccharide biosynthesis protein [Enterovirga sp. DB1703]